MRHHALTQQQQQQQQQKRSKHCHNRRQTTGDFRDVCCSFSPSGVLPRHSDCELRHGERANASELRGNSRMNQSNGRLRKVEVKEEFGSGSDDLYTGPVHSLMTRQAESAAYEGHFSMRNNHGVGCQLVDRHGYYKDQRASDDLPDSGEPPKPPPFARNLRRAVRCRQVVADSAATTMPSDDWPYRQRECKTRAANEQVPQPPLQHSRLSSRRRVVYRGESIAQANVATDACCSSNSYSEEMIFPPMATRCQECSAASPDHGEAPDIYDDEEEVIDDEEDGEEEEEEDEEEVFEENWRAANHFSNQQPEAQKAKIPIDLQLYSLVPASASPASYLYMHDHEPLHPPTQQRTPVYCPAHRSFHTAAGSPQAEVSQSPYINQIPPMPPSKAEFQNLANRQQTSPPQEHPETGSLKQRRVRANAGDANAYVHEIFAHQLMEWPDLYAASSADYLCTSSSNCCCRGNKKQRSQSTGGSPPESSLNLVSGTTILSRPGSLPGINIDGLKSRGLRCAHERLEMEEGEGQLDGTEFEEGQLQTETPKVHKKTVSFSMKLEEEAEVSANKTESGEKFHTDTEASEMDSNTMEYEAGRRASLRDSSGDPNSKEMENLSAARDSQGNVSLAGSTDCASSASVTLRQVEIGCGSEAMNSKFDANEAKLASRQASDESKSVSDTQLNSGVPLINDSNARKRGTGVATPGKKRASQDILRQAVVNRETQRRASKSERVPGLELTNSSPSRQDQTSGRSGGVSSQQMPPTGGSNCANSSAAAFPGGGHLAFGSARELRRQQLRRGRDVHFLQQHSSTYADWTGRSGSDDVSAETPTTASATTNTTGTGKDSLAVECGSYVIFQHPPEMSTAKKSNRMVRSNHASHRYQSHHLKADEFSSSLSLCWTSKLGNEGNSAVDFGPGSAGYSSTRLDRSNASDREKRKAPKKTAGSTSSGLVLYKELRTTEDRLTSFKPDAVSVRHLQAGDVVSEPLVKPSAVLRDSAAYSIARSIVQSPGSSGEKLAANGEGTSSESSSESYQPCLMLEAISCAHPDGSQCSGCCRSHSTASKQPSPRKPTATAARISSAPPPSLASTQKKQHNSERSSPPARQKYPTAAQVDSPKSHLAAATAATEVVGPASRNNGSSSNASNPKMSGNPPRQSLKRSLMRGLKCNVESLRSTLEAARLVLGGEGSNIGGSGNATNHLDDAIGTASALHALIRQAQASQRAAKVQARLKLSQNDGQKRMLDSALMDAAVQCQAMSHYLIGEQHVEPTLEQRSSLKCRPITTRVVCTESQTGRGLAAQNSQRVRKI